MQSLRRAAQLAGCEPKFCARRSDDGLVGFEVLLADERAARGEARDQARHQRAVDVAYPNDEVEWAPGQRALQVRIEVLAQPPYLEPALGSGAAPTLETDARDVECRDAEAVRRQIERIAT